jgi:hypothetical protein
MSRTAGYTWTNHKANRDTAKELNITPVLGKMHDSRENGYM